MTEISLSSVQVVKGLGTIMTGASRIPPKGNGLRRGGKSVSRMGRRLALDTFTLSSSTGRINPPPPFSCGEGGGTPCLLVFFFFFFFFILILSIIRV